MFDDVATIFYNNVVSTYEDYTVHRDRNSTGRDHHLRSAVEAATALFHFREHLPASHQMSRRQVENLCSDYKLVADVVNATKHGQLTMGAPILRSAEDVQEVTIITRYVDDDGEYSDARTIVQVNCLDGTTRNLDLAITNVLNFWGGKLKEWGIAEYSARPVPEVPGTRHISRGEASSLDLEVLRGLRLKQTMQLLRFNADKGYAEPVDLTGSKLELRIYRPAYELNLEFTRRDTGQKIEVTIVLSDDESERLHGLAGDTERQMFLQQMVEARRSEIETAASEALGKNAAAEEIEPIG